MSAGFITNEGEMNMKCPNCGIEMIHSQRNEEFEYDTGRGVVQVQATRVPIDECPKCGEVASGPLAAGRRADAILRAVIDYLHRLVPPSSEG